MQQDERTAWVRKLIDEHSEKLANLRNQKLDLPCFEMADVEFRLIGLRAMYQSLLVGSGFESVAKSARDAAEYAVLQFNKRTEWQSQRWDKTANAYLEGVVRFVFTESASQRTKQVTVTRDQLHHVSFMTTKCIVTGGQAQHWGGHVLMQSCGEILDTLQMRLPVVSVLAGFATYELAMTPAPRGCHGVWKPEFGIALDRPRDSLETIREIEQVTGHKRIMNLHV